MTITTTTLVTRVEHTCPYCSEKFSEDYSPAPNGEPMGSPIVKCRFCNGEFYDGKIIEYHALPEEEAKALAAMVPKSSKLWYILSKVCALIALVLMFSPEALEDYSMIIVPVIMILLVVALIGRKFQSTVGAFLKEKRKSWVRMNDDTYVKKLNRYKKLYKAPEVNLAMDMSALDFIRKADELMSAEEQAGSES